jgi:hypothetical protein
MSVVNAVIPAVRRLSNAAFFKGALQAVPNVNAI